MTGDAYALGRTDAEYERLALQSKIINPITARLLDAAGVGPGMRVLDIGTGVGDVAFLAAERVGPQGEVVGIDCDPKVLCIARRQAAEGYYANMTFQVGTETQHETDGRYDVVAARLVLCHQPDPIQFLRAAASLVRPGGVLVIHDAVLHGPPFSKPQSPEWDYAMGLAAQALGAVLPNPDAGARLFELFRLADLSEPTVSCELPVAGGASSLFYEWCAEALRSLLPHAERLNIYSAPDLENLAQRIRDNVVAAGAQIAGPHQYCGWAQM
jgi:SAM-dependent methyltransferase